MLTAQEAFRVGFLAKCAEDGLSAPELAGRLKTAQGVMQSALSGASSWGHKALLAGLLAPVVAGAAGGYGLARMTDIDDTDVDDVKRQELIDAYRRHTERLKAVGELHARRAHPVTGGRRVF